MKKIIFILSMLICTSGCLSINQLMNDNCKEKVYCGVRSDIAGMTWLISDEPAWAFLALFDFPFAIVWDTLFLPYTIPHDFSRKESEKHQSKTVAIVKKWENIKINASVSQLNTLAESQDWIKQAFVQVIHLQTGKWKVRIERGYTIVRVYLFDEKVYSNIGIIIKLDTPKITKEEFIKELREKRSEIDIVEYATFGKGLNNYHPKLKQTSKKISPPNHLSTPLQDDR